MAMKKLRALHPLKFLVFVISLSNCQKAITSGLQPSTLPELVLQNDYQRACPLLHIYNATTKTCECFSGRLVHEEVLKYTEHRGLYYITSVQLLIDTQ